MDLNTFSIDYEADRLDIWNDEWLEEYDSFSSGGSSEDNEPLVTPSSSSQVSNDGSLGSSGELDVDGRKYLSSRHFTFNQACYQLM
jgi:hypothetical protein